MRAEREARVAQTVGLSISERGRRRKGVGRERARGMLRRMREVGFMVDVGGVG